MNLINFDRIARHSGLIEENEFFKLYHNPDAPYMYDYNFMELTYQPTVEEFKLIEEIQLDFQTESGLEHIKFYWPENKGFTEEILSYLSERDFGIEILELYAIEPASFLAAHPSHQARIELVTAESLADYKKINFEQDKQYGQPFAIKKQHLYELNYEDPFIHQVIAYLGDQPVGALDLIHSKETVEIDGFFVVKEQQQKGIGTALQQYAMDFAKGRIVILVADGEDTPKEMYEKQQYRYISYRVGAQKIIKKPQN